MESFVIVFLPLSCALVAAAKIPVPCAGSLEEPLEQIALQAEPVQQDTGPPPVSADGGAG